MELISTCIVNRAGWGLLGNKSTPLTLQAAPQYLFLTSHVI